MEVLILKLVEVFAPIVGGIIQRHRAEHGVDPTDEQVVAEFRANIADILAEGAAWRASKKGGLQ